MFATFQVENQLFEIPKDKIVQSTYLSAMVDLDQLCKSNGPIILHVKLDDMNVIHDLLTKCTIPKYDMISVLDYFDIDCSSMYELSVLHKIYYMEYHEKMDLSPYFGLQAITKNYWNGFRVNTSTPDKLTIRAPGDLKPQQWNAIKSKLSTFDKILQSLKSKAVIVGDALFDTLFGLTSSNVNVVIYQFNDENVFEDIVNLEKLGKTTHMDPEIILTVNNADNTKDEYHIKYIKYKTIAEIVYNEFNIDCCQMCYDATNIWISNTGLYSIKNAINTINDRCNNTIKKYIDNMSAYLNKGMSIKFDEYMVCKYKLVYLLFLFLDCCIKPHLNYSHKI